MSLKMVEFSIILLLVSVSADEVVEFPGLEPQMTIEVILYAIRGDRFHINLQEATEDGGQGDIDLHIGMRYRANKLALNTKINGEWGQEQAYYYNYPFKTDSYNVLITARKNSFLININGSKFIFKYRMPRKNLGNIKFLALDGGKGGKIDVTLLDWEAAQCQCQCQCGD